jgi:hypothetical protein
MAKKRKAKIKRKRAAKKSKPQKSKPKKRSTGNVDVLTPVISDDALERSAILPHTAACTERLCL